MTFVDMLSSKIKAVEESGGSTVEVVQTTNKMVGAWNLLQWKSFGGDYEALPKTSAEMEKK